MVSLVKALIPITLRGNEAVKSQLRSGFCWVAATPLAPSSVYRVMYQVMFNKFVKLSPGTPSVNDKPVSKQNFIGKTFH
jgi:hypothetical protein